MDGSPTAIPSRPVRGASLDGYEALAWLEQRRHRRLRRVGSGEEASLETNFGVRSRPIRWLYLATREVSWRVMNVEPHEGDDAERSARSSPASTRSRWPVASITNNCGACEPECPVEAIFPEDALPDKWEPFVKINYAYGDGFDVVNNLTNEYATEHNVQNPPLTTIRPDPLRELGLRKRRS